jgi:hypothetical protein
MVVIVLLVVGTVATTLAIPATSPPPTPTIPSDRQPLFRDATAPPVETPFGRYPTGAESGIVASCVSGIDPSTVPGPIAQAFCVCTLNTLEQLYPTYDEFQRATAAGAITDKLRTDISNRCAIQLVGG